MELCRDRFGYFTAGVFQIWTCSQCYKYLFPNITVVDSSNSSSSTLLPTLHITSPSGEEVQPSWSNVSAIDRVCSWMDRHSCERWKECCTAAIACCNQQLQQSTVSRETARIPPHNGSLDLTWGVTWSGAQEARGQRYCPRTWDGFSCFEHTLANTTASVTCPSFIEQNDATAVGVRICTENGTWWTDPQTGQEWTDYTSCVPMQGYHLLYLVGVACNSISLFLVIPACVIFICFRSLRRQHRIRIHLNLFLAFLITYGSLLLWENVVYKDRLLNDKPIMHQDTVPCKVLYIVTRYAWLVAFFWMFLEGFYLYRLISNAFQTPKTIRPYYLFGWGGAAAPVTTYTAVRVYRQDDRCWIFHAGSLEWLIYGPELMCIIANVFFFVGIMRILVTEIQSHPNEPSNYRRAIKATFILVPLFGLQLFLVAYSPGANHPVAHITHEIVAKIVSSSQGAVVAVIFCYCNSEVHAHFRSTLTNRSRQHPNGDIRSVTISTHTTMVDTARGSYSAGKRKCKKSSAPTLDRRERTSYIALNAWSASGLQTPGEALP